MARVARVLCVLASPGVVVSAQPTTTTTVASTSSPAATTVASTSPASTTTEDLQEFCKSTVAHVGALELGAKVLVNNSRNSAASTVQIAKADLDKALAKINATTAARLDGLRAQRQEKVGQLLAQEANLTDPVVHTGAGGGASSEKAVRSAHQAVSELETKLQHEEKVVQQDEKTVKHDEDEAKKLEAVDQKEAEDGGGEGRRLKGKKDKEEKHDKDKKAKKEKKDKKDKKDKKGKKEKKDKKGKKEKKDKKDKKDKKNEKGKKDEKGEKQHKEDKKDKHDQKDEKEGKKQEEEKKEEKKEKNQKKEGEKRERQREREEKEHKQKVAEEAESNKKAREHLSVAKTTEAQDQKELAAAKKQSPSNTVTAADVDAARQSYQTALHAARGRASDIMRVAAGAAKAISTNVSSPADAAAVNASGSIVVERAHIEALSLEQHVNSTLGAKLTEIEHQFEAQQRKKEAAEAKTQAQLAAIGLTYRQKLEAVMNASQEEETSVLQEAQRSSAGARANFSVIEASARKLSDSDIARVKSWLAASKSEAQQLLEAKGCNVTLPETTWEEVPAVALAEQGGIAAVVESALWEHTDAARGGAVFCAAVLLLAGLAARLRQRSRSQHSGDSYALLV